MTQKAIHNHNVIHIKIGDTKKKRRSHRRKKTPKSLVAHAYNPISPLTNIQQQLPTNKPYYIETKTINPQLQDKPTSTDLRSFAPSQAHSVSLHDLIPPPTPSFARDLARNPHGNTDSTLSSQSMLSSSLSSSPNDDDNMSEISYGHTYPAAFPRQHHTPSQHAESHDNSFGPFTHFHSNAMHELHQEQKTSFHDHAEDVKTSRVRLPPNPKGLSVAQYQQELKNYNRRVYYNDVEIPRNRDRTGMQAEDRYAHNLRTEEKEAEERLKPKVSKSKSKKK